MSKLSTASITALNTIADGMLSGSTVTRIAPELMHGLFPDSVGQTIFDGRLVVTKVLNGYVVQYMNNPSKQPDVYVESDLEGVNNRIKTLMATFRLEQK